MHHHTTARTNPCSVGNVKYLRIVTALFVEVILHRWHVSYLAIKTRSPQSAGPGSPLSLLSAQGVVERMKIALYSHSIPPAVDGVSRRMASLLQELTKKQGHQVCHKVGSAGQSRRCHGTAAARHRRHRFPYFLLHCSSAFLSSSHVGR